MNPITTVILTTAFAVLGGQFPSFKPALADIQHDISNGKVGVADIEQLVVDAATGAEDLIPSEKTLIGDGIKVFVDAAQFVEDLQKKNA